MKPSKLVFAGNIPYLAALMLAAGAFYAGYSYCVGTIKPQSKIVYAEKAAVVYGQMIKMEEVSDDALDAKLRKPILDVLTKYQRAGYVIIDASKDDAGNMSIMALPAEARDITPELEAAVARAAGQAGGNAPSKPARRPGE